MTRDSILEAGDVTDAFVSEEQAIYELLHGKSDLAICLPEGVFEGERYVMVCLVEHDWPHIEIYSLERYKEIAGIINNCHLISKPHKIHFGNVPEVVKINARREIKIPYFMAKDIAQSPAYQEDTKDDFFPGGINTDNYVVNVVNENQIQLWDSRIIAGPEQLRSFNDRTERKLSRIA